MPKIIDRPKIQRDISTAVLHVLQKRGVRALTVRAIAAEAHLPASTLRHYFPAQKALVTFTMEMVKCQATARITHILSAYSGVDRLRQITYQFLPLDAERELEMQVWIFYIGEASNTAMCAFRASIQDEIYQLFYDLIAGLKDAHLLSQTVDIAYEALHLQTMTDGLALHYLSKSTPESRQKIQSIVDHYIDRLQEGVHG